VNDWARTDPWGEGPGPEEWFADGDSKASAGADQHEQLALFELPEEPWQDPAEVEDPFDDEPDYADESWDYDFQVHLDGPPF